MCVSVWVWVWVRARATRRACVAVSARAVFEYVKLRTTCSLNKLSQQDTHAPVLKLKAVIKAVDSFICLIYSRTVYRVSRLRDAGMRGCCAVRDWEWALRGRCRDTSL